MVSLSLPLSVLGTFSLLPFMGVSFNVITMLAFVICIGMLVDNSVVIGEYYSRLITDKNESPQSAALNSVHQFAKPITATVLTNSRSFFTHAGNQRGYGAVYKMDTYCRHDCSFNESV